MYALPGTPPLRYKMRQLVGRDIYGKGEPLNATAANSRTFHCDGYCGGLDHWATPTT